MSSESYKVDSNNIPDASNLKIGIVVSRWNHSITDNLLKGSIALLESKNTAPENIQIIYVPGSFELVFGSRHEFRC